METTLNVNNCNLNILEWIYLALYQKKIFKYFDLEKNKKERIEVDTLSLSFFLTLFLFLFLFFFFFSSLGPKRTQKNVQRLFHRWSIVIDDSILVPLGLFFHVVGEGVVRLLKNGRASISDRENYIDFRMRLLGEPGIINQYKKNPYCQD